VTEIPLPFHWLDVEFVLSRCCQGAEAEAEELKQFVAGADPDTVYRGSSSSPLDGTVSETVDPAQRSSAPPN
jgi:hypothetical protein